MDKNPKLISWMEEVRQRGKLDLDLGDTKEEDLYFIVYTDVLIRDDKIGRVRRTNLLAYYQFDKWGGDLDSLWLAPPNPPT